MLLSRFMRQSVVILFHSLLLITPLIFTWANEELFEFPKMLVVYAFTALISAAWICRIIAEKKWSVTKTFFDIPVLTFLISQLLSTLFSIHPRTSLFGYYTRFHGGLLSTICYTILYYAFVNNVAKPQLKGFFKTLMISALCISLYAIPEHFGHSPSCALIGGTFDVSCWVQDVQTRIFGTFGQPNWIAAYAITLLPMAMVLASYRFSLTNLIPILAGPGLFLTLLFSRSRSGFVGFALSMVVMATGYTWLHFQKNGLRISSWFTTSTKLFIAHGLFLGVLLAWFGSPFTPALSAKLQQQTSSQELTSPNPVAAPVNRLEEGGTDSGEIRKIVWEGTVSVWKRYPILGSGVETFAYSYYQDRPMAHNLVSEWDFLYNKAHNEFLNFLATTGLFGLGSYVLLLLWFATVVGIHLVKSDTAITLKNKQLLLAMVSGVTALTVSNFFGFSTVPVSVLLFLFLALVEMLVTTKEESALTPKVGGGQKMSMAVVWLIAGWLVLRVWNIWAADHNYYLAKSYFQAGYAVQGVNYFQTAIEQMPNEALYHDELASSLAKLAVLYDQQQQTTQSAQLGAAAIQESNAALALNDRHLNFHKTRIRIFILLSEIEPGFLTEAKNAVETALTLAPTDAKLVHTLGTIETELQQVPEATASFQKAIAMKPNYESARIELAKLYEQSDNSPAAVEQYQYIYDHLTQNNELVNEKLKTLKK